jgi:hypothetical protein
VAGRAGAAVPAARSPPPDVAATTLRVTSRHLNRALDQLLDSRNQLTGLLPGGRGARGADAVIRPVLPPSVRAAESFPATNRQSPGHTTLPIAHHDFEDLGVCTGQPVEWVADPGSL